MRLSVSAAAGARVWSKFTSTKSRGMNLVVSALATFSAKDAGAPGASILVRSIEKIGTSEIGILAPSGFRRR